MVRNGPLRERGERSVRPKTTAPYTRRATTRANTRDTIRGGGTLPVCTTAGTNGVRTTTNTTGSTGSNTTGSTASSTASSTTSMVHTTGSTGSSNTVRVPLQRPHVHKGPVETHRVIPRAVRHAGAAQGFDLRRRSMIR